MANVMFKRGLASALPTGSSIKDGVFYLTTDTNRLYIGQQLTESATPELIELNKSIEVVNTIDDLPSTDVAVGQFYYVKGSGTTAADNTHNGNILAVVVSTNPVRWVQVNPDTDGGYDEVSSLAVGTPSINTTAGTITYTITLGRDHKNADNTTSSLSDKTATFTINSSDIGQIVSATAVAIGSSAVASNSTTINTSGNGSAGNGFTVTGSDNVTLSGSANALTIYATDSTYSLASPANSATLQLSETVADGATTSTSTKNTITFDAGTALEVSGATASHISYSHANVSCTTTTDSTNAVLGDGDTLTVVDGVTVNDQGHVTAVTKKTIEIEDEFVDSATIGASGEDITLTLGRNVGNDVTATGGTGALWHNLTIDGTTQKISNQGTFATNIYSAAQVDSLIAGLNAMTYKGTVGSTGADVTTLPTSGVKVGDTYMVKTAGAGPDAGSEAGDLYIASGTETNGVITSGLTWTLVPAGNDPDTTYTFSVDSNGIITAIPSTGGTNQTVAQIAAGTALTKSVSNSVITIAHGNIGTATTYAGKNTTTTLTAGGTFKVPYLTTDAQGHVSAVSDVTLTLPADDDTTYSISVDSATGGAAVKLTPSTGTATTAVVVGDGTSISVAKDSSNLKISHEDLLTSGTAGTTYGSSASTTPAAGGSIKIPSLKVNAQGHVTEVGEQTITLPADSDKWFSLRPTTVAVATASDTTTATATFHMSDRDDSTQITSSSTLKISSESLTIAQPSGTTDEVNVNIVWGSF